MLMSEAWRSSLGRGHRPWRTPVGKKPRNNKDRHGRGSIIVTSGAGRARSAALVPPVYLAFLPVRSIYPDLPTWMAQEGARLLPGTANLVIITGPSRTADIELTLIIGVHGPGEIHVILIDETAADDPIG